jgi:hypothetical protein
MSEPSTPGPEPQRASDSMEKKRREAVAQIAERNRQAHLKAVKQRQEYDRMRIMNRGPNPR